MVRPTSSLAEPGAASWLKRRVHSLAQPPVHALSRSAGRPRGPRRRLEALRRWLEGVGVVAGLGWLGRGADWLGRGGPGRGWGFASALVAVGLAAPIAAAQPRGPAPTLLCRSVGSPTDGRLVGGVELRERAYVRVRSGAVRFAVPELVALLDDVSRTVATRRPGAVVLVGDLSERDGGPLAGHASHTSGRDADVAYPLMDERGRPAPVERFHTLDAHGVSRVEGRLRLDVGAAWLLVQELLRSPRADVQRIFLAPSVRERLLAHAVEQHTPKRVLDRARAVLLPESGHEHHFHVRIGCPQRSRGVCVNAPRPLLKTARQP